jgi:hypothetical protein
MEESIIPVRSHTSRFSRGTIVTRQTTPETIRRRIFSVWNDSSPRKVILTLSDSEVNELLDVRCRGGSPTKWMQSHYRKFRTSVQ